MSIGVLTDIAEIIPSPVGGFVVVIDCFIQILKRKAEYGRVYPLETSEKRGKTMEKFFTVPQDSFALPMKVTEPDFGPVSRCILGVHGFGGHKESEVLLSISEEMGLFGAATVCFDLPCHGENPMTEKDLSQAGHTAFLGYTDALYVSGNNIFTTREYIKDCTMTEISWVSYGEALEYRGSISVAGWVKDQYSMDEYEGILRVVTSTDDGGAGRNASLYCIDIESKKVVASVEKFAPEGERAESVRFDGTMAYVCTAEVVTLTDPVYFFDLSDLENITVKDTGTIDGYSSSLVNFGDGFLLGIGFGDTRQLKIEIYAENDTGVVSVDTLELEAEFSLDYKSYLIDRENKLIGLGIWSWDSGDTQYLLVGFDGVRLKTLKEEPLEGNVHQMRATIIDGWLYLLAKEFKAVPLM